MADTIALKSGEQMKGLVVEEHEDRVILNTEKGEVPVLRADITNIDYDDPAQNFLSMGRAYEEKQRWPEALAYYEKAADLNPGLEDARKASVRMRNIFWAKSAVGPVAEIEKRQAMHDRFAGKAPTEKDASKLLEEGLGARLAKKGDWVVITEVLSKRDASRAGLKRNDRLVSVDGSSTRYLTVEAVQEKLTSPRYSSYTLEYERDLPMVKTGFEKDPRDFGLDIKLETSGMVVTRVKAKGTAAKAGVKDGDLVVAVDGQSTRYLPLKKLMAVVQKNPAELKTVFTVRRSALLTRH